MSEIFEMSGYALYVWSSVGIVIVALGWMSWRARAAFKRVQAKVNWSHDAQP